MYKFTFLIVFAIVGFTFAKEKPIVHLQPEILEKAFESAAKCIAETGLSADIFEQVRNRKLAGDETTQKFLHCVMKNLGFINKSGHLKVDKLVDIYPKNHRESVKTVFEECNKEDGKTSLETTFQVIKCFQSKTPVHIAI